MARSGYCFRNNLFWDDEEINEFKLCMDWFKIKNGPFEVGVVLDNTRQDAMG